MSDEQRLSGESYRKGKEIGRMETKQEILEIIDNYCFSDDTELNIEIKRELKKQIMEQNK